MPADVFAPSSSLDPSSSMPAGWRSLDDIAFGDCRVMIVVGARRLIASGLTRGDVEDLKKAYRTGRLNQSLLLANIVRRIPPSSDKTTEEPSRRWILLHSVNLVGPVRFLSKMIDWRWMLLFAVSILVVAASRLQSTTDGIVDSLRLIAHPSVSTYPIVIATVASLALIHETAHLAACYRFSGIVGSLGFFLAKRSGGLCADVSAMTRLPSPLMAQVYIAGPAAQALASAMLLLAPAPPLRVAGLASLMLCLANLVPLPGTDGFNALAAARRKSGDRQPVRKAN